MTEVAERDARRTLAPFGRRRGEVVRNQAVGAYRVLAVRDPDGPSGPRPGQFYMLATAVGWSGAAGERPYLPRAFSFARVRTGPDGSTEVEFLLEAIGLGTERLGGVAPGEEMWLTGPLGVGFSTPAPDERPLLVGGGIGAAPILCWHDELGERAEVLLGFRSAEHARAAELFGPAVTAVTDDGSVGREALVTELLREALDGGTEAHEVAVEADVRPKRAARGARPRVYACGPPQMLEAVRAICAERDVVAELALEAGMACGFGACFGCVVPTREGYARLCLDGPVLEAAMLETAAAAGSGH